MIIPVRCFTCGKVIGNKYEKYMRMLDDDEDRAMDELGLKRYCCRRMILTHVDLIDQLLQYNSELGARLVRWGTRAPGKTGLSCQLRLASTWSALPAGRPPCCPHDSARAPQTQRSVPASASLGLALPRSFRPQARWRCRWPGWARVIEPGTPEIPYHLASLRFAAGRIAAGRIAAGRIAAHVWLPAWLWRGIVFSPVAAPFLCMCV
ncbi:Rpb10 [Symbiodinium sp. KB8]|nr:Rpb10 [Symbiodinium sp. KB8]